MKMENKKISILIADDFKLLRDVIRAYVELESDMEVLGEAPDLNDALQRASELRPDVILVNDYLPPLDSAHAAQQFRSHGISAGILTISMSLEPELIERSFQHDITGFLYKDEINEVLVQAIRNVYQGERFLSPKARSVYGKNLD